LLFFFFLNQTEVYAASPSTNPEVFANPNMAKFLAASVQIITYSLVCCSGVDPALQHTLVSFEAVAFFYYYYHTPEIYNVAADFAHFLASPHYSNIPPLTEKVIQEPFSVSAAFKWLFGPI